MTDSTFFNLPFVEAQFGKATQLWATQPSGDWSADVATGKAHADALLVYMRDENDPSVLPFITRAIGESGRWAGIEVGFFHRMAEAAINGGQSGQPSS